MNIFVMQAKTDNVFQLHNIQEDELIFIVKTPKFVKIERHYDTNPVKTTLWHQLILVFSFIYC